MQGNEVDIKKIYNSYILHTEGFCLNRLKGEVNLNLGCGNRPLDGFINTDFFNDSYADKLFDLDKEFPFEDESIDLIFSDNVFEHMKNLIDIMGFCHAALKKGGHLVIKVPYFKSKHAFVDPTHVRFFTIQSLDYFIKGTYFNNQYKFNERAFEKINIFLDPKSNNRLRNMVATYAIKRPNHFENSIMSNLIVFNNIVYVLRK